MSSLLWRLSRQTVVQLILNNRIDFCLYFFFPYSNILWNWFESISWSFFFKLKQSGFYHVFLVFRCFTYRLSFYFRYLTSVSVTCFICIFFNSIELTNNTQNKIFIMECYQEKLVSIQANLFNHSSKISQRNSLNY